MTMVILVLLAGFGAGFYYRGRRAEIESETAARYAETLERQIEGFRVKLAQQTEAAASRKRLREENDISNPENQIRFISQAGLYSVKPVNREAAPVLYAIKEYIAANHSDWHFSFEVSMGSFIKTRHNAPHNDRAFSSYNSKRVDFLLVDRRGNPKLAVEYNGSGHDLADDAKARMEVKRLALTRAHIPLLEIPANMGKPEIMNLLAETLANEAS